MGFLVRVNEASDRWAVATRLLWQPLSWQERDALRVAEGLLASGVADGDLYFQYRHAESWALEEGIVKTGSFSIDAGVGVRAIVGDQQALAYTDVLEPEAVVSAAQTVRAIARGGSGGVVAVSPRRFVSDQAYYAADDPLASLSSEAKVDLLHRLEAKARALDGRLDQVIAHLVAVWEAVIVVRLDGTIACDIRPLVRLSLTVIAHEAGRREVGSAGIGGRYLLTRFDEAVLDQLARQAVHQAEVNLAARPAPAGVMPVVLGPGWPGVLKNKMEKKR